MIRRAGVPYAATTAALAVTLAFLAFAGAFSPAGWLSVTPAGAAASPAPKTSLPEIEDEVMCPICGTLLSLSASPAAQRQRVFIRKLIRQGKTKDEIKDALVAEYGGQVLAEPEEEGISLWAYALPTALIGLAAVAVVTSIVRRRRLREEPGDESPTGPESDGSTDPDDERLDRDMARFDL